MFLKEIQEPLMQIEDSAEIIQVLIKAIIYFWYGISKVYLATKRLHHRVTSEAWLPEGNSICSSV